MTRRIAVEVPAGAAQAERVERRVFERLDALRDALAVPPADQRGERVERELFARLAGIRAAERAERVAPTRARAGWIPWAALAGVVAASVIVIAVALGSLRASGERAGDATSLIVVPPGQTTRFAEGDSVIVAGGDTSVEVIRGAGVTLALAYGSVECSVAPRDGRPPFRVVAGDVRVEVVGTHFTVVRRPEGVRVDVMRGRVRVTSPRGDAYVSAGETWPAAIAGAQPTPAPPSPPAPPPPAPASSPPPTEPAPEPPVELAPEPPATPEPAPEPPARPARAGSRRDAYKAAERLEATDRAAAARAYRAIADSHDPWAPIALARFVDVERDRGRAAGALRAIDEYLRRFPSGPAVEDLLWTRVDIHRTAQRRDALRAAAAAYLQRFPSGTYASAARRFAAP